MLARIVKAWQQPTISNSPEFDDAVRAAGRKAFEESLEAGLPVCYIDSDGFNVMQYPDGRKFEIRWIPGAPAGKNYEVIRELTAHAAWPDLRKMGDPLYWKGL